MSCVLLLAGLLATASPAVAAPAVALADILVGAWTMTPVPGVVSGTIRFDGNGHYTRSERHADGTGMEASGQYRLDTSRSPCALDLCLGDCDQPGAEWTTLLAIVRRRDDGRLELRWSPDGVRPAGFAAADDPCTQFLTRVATDP